MGFTPNKARTFSRALKVSKRGHLDHGFEFIEINRNSFFLSNKAKELL